MTKILVTGATGFVGANLVHRLVAKKADVYCMVRPKSDMWRLKGVLGRLAVHKADLADARAVKRVVRNVRPDVVYHAAAHGLFLKQEEAEQMAASNVLGTVNLLEALHHTGTVRRIVNIGSFAEYNPDELYISENSPLCPSNAYGASKASQSFFAQYYARCYKMPIVIMRPTLIYGPYEEARRLVPASILAQLRVVTLKLSSPKPRKDFLFIEDALDAFELAVRRDIAPGEIFNIGLGKEYSIQEVVSAIQHCTKVSVPLQWGLLEGRPWDSPQKHTYDISKAKRLLGWRPSHTLEDGLLKTIRWFKKYHALYP